MTAIDRVVVLAGLVMITVACGNPVGYRTIGPRDAYRDLTASALTEDDPSVFSRRLLARLGLSDVFRKDPELVLAALHRGLGWVDEQDRLFSLAELSVAHAEKAGDRAWFLAAAVYAYAFLFPPDPADAPPRFDPRLGLALDVYERGLTMGLASGEDDQLDLTPRTVALPFGALTLDVHPGGWRYEGYRLERFVPTRTIRVYGLRNVYRRAGLGAQLAAKLGRRDDERETSWIAPTATVPVTLVVHFDDVRATLITGAVRGRVGLYDPDVALSICVAEQVVPLESDPSSVLAYHLEGAPIWDFEIAGFRRSDLDLFGTGEEIGLFMIRPYRPGRIPVVFVHGTASSPARWAEMANELLTDARLAPRYQFWFFIYNTGNPVAYSAMRLRKALTQVIADIDPKAQDPALRHMVVIGHSQGGLMTKMMAVESGDHMWNALYDTPFDEVRMPKRTRELLRDVMFYEPVPSVTRVVFIATPHRGSFLAGNWLGNLARRLVRLPAGLTRASVQLLQLRPKIPLPSRRSLTSIDSMNPANPTLQVLASLPLAEGIRGHSIIAVRGTGPTESGNDGVVTYRSAHLDGLDSELVVRAPHSCQGRPETIEEVRRILHLHLESVEGELGPASLPASDPCTASRRRSEPGDLQVRHGPDRTPAP